MEYLHKSAKKKLTKSQKKQAGALRDEITWVRQTKAWPFSDSSGEDGLRQLHLIVLNIKLEKIYEEQG